MRFLNGMTSSWVSPVTILGALALLLMSAALPVFAEPATEADMALKGRFVQQESNAELVRIYVFSLDFPPRGLFHNFFESSSQTNDAADRFIQSLQKAFSESTRLRLVRDVNQSDYRANLRCSGIIYCKDVKVELVRTQNYQVDSFSIPGGGLIGPPNLDTVAGTLVHTLETRLPYTPAR